MNDYSDKEIKDYSDKEIIEGLKSRNSHVVNYLFQRYLPMIRLMVFKMGGTADDAKDLFQDALIIILYKIDNDTLSLTCKIKVFIYSICENLMIKQIDKRQSASNYLVRKLDDTPVMDFSEMYDNKLYENMFYDMFETLEPVCKKMLKLYWESYSPKEIAEKLGYTYGYVRKKKCECQSELINKVKNHPDYISITSEKERIKKVIHE